MGTPELLGDLTLLDILGPMCMSDPFSLGGYYTWRYPCIVTLSISEHWTFHTIPYSKIAAWKKKPAEIKELIIVG